MKRTTKESYWMKKQQTLKEAPSGFEPLTSGLLDQRSNQLS